MGGRALESRPRKVGAVHRRRGLWTGVTLTEASVEGTYRAAAVQRGGAGPWLGWLALGGLMGAIWVTSIAVIRGGFSDTATAAMLAVVYGIGAAALLAHEHWARRTMERERPTALSCVSALATITLTAAPAQLAWTSRSGFSDASTLALVGDGALAIIGALLLLISLAGWFEADSARISAEQRTQLLEELANQRSLASNVAGFARHLLNRLIRRGS